MHDTTPAPDSLCCAAGAARSQRAARRTFAVATMLCAALVALGACAADARRPRGGSRLDGGARDFGPDVDAAPMRDASAGTDAGGDLGRSDDAGPATDAGRDAGPPPLPTCQRRCTLASDCSSGSPATDADNYACESGACRYLGCRNDAECTATFGAAGGTWRCVTPPDGGLPACAETCTAPADCASPSPAVDADNYACESGACRYLGCRNDAECTATFGAAGGTWRCVAPSAGALPTCSEACTAPVDCASPSPAVDADNYACEAGTCRYLGCRDDAECTATFGTSGGDWTCR